jgi:hypothetical protein
MNKTKLFIIVVTTGLIACNTQTDSNNSDHSSFNVNAELKKRNGDSVTYYQHLQIDSILNVIIKNDTIGTALGKSQDGIPYLVLARTKPGFAEIHEQLDDIAIINSGHGTLKTGYQVTGKINTTGEEPWRNWFCEGIKDGTERKLSPGDFIIIPAMTAHQYIPDRGDTLTYWTIKVRHIKNTN